jgi:NADH dehydrogenase/NADH:ubiquinone oxidoreductase subunit G
LQQGGECDLQDQVFLYGTATSRFSFKKRIVEDKNLGLFIKSIMTRCIHCTRCIRFSQEVAGTQLLGTLNRGQKTEIGTYVVGIFKSHIAGNVIDLCPVGALTSRLYAFKTRPWELKTTDSIDLTDSTGSAIFVAVKQINVVRVTPKKTMLSDTGFISDKARFSFDALNNLRLLESF